MAVFCGQVRNVFTHVLLSLLILTQSRKDAQSFLLMFCSLLVKVLRDTLRLCVIQNYVLIL